MVKLRIKNPLVSYIIPCYNQSRYLYEAIASIHLSYRGLKEIIIVNDSSNEPCWESNLNAILDQFPNVIVINHPKNKGLSVARNSGVEASSGEYIQFLDSDDLLAPMKIDYQLKHFSLVRNLGVSVTDYILSDDTLSYFFQDETCIGTFMLEIKDFLYSWERGLSIPIHCGLFDRNIVINCKFNETLHGKEDWVFWCTLAYHKQNITFLNFNGAIYRQHSNAMTKRKPNQMGRSWKIAASIIDEIIEHSDPGFLPSAETWYRDYYLRNEAQP